MMPPGCVDAEFALEFRRQFVVAPAGQRRKASTKHPARTDRFPLRPLVR